MKELEEDQDNFFVELDVTLHEKTMYKVYLVHGLTALIGEPKNEANSENWRIRRLEFDKDYLDLSDVKFFLDICRVKILPAEETKTAIGSIENWDTFWMERRGEYRWIIYEKGTRKIPIEEQLKSS